jgi:hypothetical protein
MVQGEKILDLSVDTGKNLPFYPSQAQVIAIGLCAERQGWCGT